MRPTIIIAFIFLCPAAFAATIHVPDDYATIQEAIDAAVNGDTVLVAPGTYVENIDFIGTAIPVKSSDGAESTIIDGGSPVDPDYGSVVTFNSGEQVESVLDGFTPLKCIFQTPGLRPSIWRIVVGLPQNNWYYSWEWIRNLPQV